MIPKNIVTGDTLRARGVGGFETRRSDEELGKLSAVHFVRFALPEAARGAFHDAEVALVVDRPNERARAVLSSETKAKPGQRPCVKTLAWAVALAIAAVGCSEQDTKLSPQGERGRQVYQSQCIACHNPDPSREGAVGPPVKGSSEELVRRKVLTGDYPPGYTPKRPTKVMQPLPPLAQDIPALAEYLR